ncbi:ABC transporter permease [Candidatus Merdisoma sp. JLR.KK006]|uniref:ABC transporter permease n=1 Tax=Candidatus Merdisoma sp. JLR.KK006 TaxID=3112626 RepID=UPI002FEFCFC5
MWNLIQAEWLKLRRCQILLVGIVALAVCPVVQYGTQLMLAPEYRDLNYDFRHLFANVIWGNSQVFLPISLVMIGGWFIDRETTHDTLKNIITVPVSMSKLLGAKLVITGMLSVVFGVYSVGVTLLTGGIVGLKGLTPGMILTSGGQVVAASFMTYLVCMPMILIFGQMRGGYLGGSIFTFFLGYSMLFFKSGLLLSAYPFSAALILTGFDMTEYNGASSPPDYLLAAAGIGFVILAAVLLLGASDRQREMKPLRRKKRKGSRRRVRGRR